MRLLGDLVLTAGHPNQFASMLRVLRLVSFDFCQVRQRFQVATLALGMMGTMIIHHDADVVQTKVLDFLRLGKTQAAHELTGSLTPRIGGISFADTIIGVLVLVMLQKI